MRFDVLPMDQLLKTSFATLFFNINKKLYKRISYFVARKRYSATDFNTLFTLTLRKYLHTLLVNYFFNKINLLW